MHKEFSTAIYRKGKLEWMAWIGQPMLYDGALCVERDYDPDARKVIAVSLDMSCRVICQQEK